MAMKRVPVGFHPRHVAGTALPHHPQLPGLHFYALNPVGAVAIRANWRQKIPFLLSSSMDASVIGDAHTSMTGTTGFRNLSPRYRGIRVFWRKDFVASVAIAAHCGNQ